MDRDLEVGEIVENSGVDFGGGRIKQMEGSNLTFESKKPEDTIIFVEVGLPNF